MLAGNAHIKGKAKFIYEQPAVGHETRQAHEVAGSQITAKLSDVLAQQPDPPGNVAQPQADRGQPLRVTANSVQLELVGLLRLAVLSLANRTEQQPAASNLGVVPTCKTI